MNLLIDRKCPVCFKDGSQPIFKRPDSLNVCFCTICTCWYVSPAPSDQQLQTFYETYDRMHRTNLVTSKKIKREYDLLNPLDDLILKEIVSFNDLAGKKILDVGFGRGELLYRCKLLKANPKGIELDRDMVRFAKEVLGIDAEFGTLFDLDINEKFDIVFMNNLVEHLLSPMDYLERAAQLLEPGGLLVIWGPNASFISAESIEPIVFRVDLEHMTYLSCSSISKIASNLLLEIIHLETLGFPNFAGLVSPINFKRKMTDIFKGYLKCFPGFRQMNKLRKMIDYKRFPDERMGNFVLFCILRRPFARI